MDRNTLKNRKTRRTTVTLEADVADYLQKRLAADKNLKEKTLVNDLIRSGISAESRIEKRPFRIRPFRTSLAEGINQKRIEELLDEI